MMSPRATHPEDAPVYVISIAAELAGMHAQTLRQYDRLGLVSPRRTRGGGRRYSARDITRLREVQRLSQAGISLSGIDRILQLEERVEALQSEVATLTARNRALTEALGSSGRVFAAGLRGEIVALPPGTRPRQPGGSTTLMLWRGQR